MSAEQASEGLSKSARKRANKKAREAEEGEEAPAPEPAPAPKAKAKAEAKAEAAPKAKAKAKAEAAPAPAPEPKAKAKGKAKAEPKAEPEPAPKAEAKAKGKAKAKAEAAPAPEPEPKAAAKAEGKAKSKSKPKKEKEEEAPKKQEAAPLGFFEMDDGKGGDWEVSTGQSKKQQKRKEKEDEKKKLAEEEAIAAAKAEKAAQKAAAAAAKAGGNKPKSADAEAKAKAKAAAKAEPVTTPAVAVVSATAVAEKEKPEEKPKEVDPNVSATVKVPQEKIGRVIGPKGSNISLIKEKTGVKTIDTAGEMVTIVGLPDAVVLAEHAVRELIEKGYMSMAFEDFQEDSMNVVSSCIPNLIGERGAIIQVIKKECKVEIDIAQVAKNSKTKTVKVSIAGGKEGVDKAKEIVSAIEKYSHHEVTHPGWSHTELEVEEWRYRFLIGKGGSEMRHIQNNYKVRVNIPREDSATDKVVVIGEERDVERAVKYIEKVLYESEQPRGRGAPEKAEDNWGDEGPEEAWMSAYMYKRR